MQATQILWLSVLALCMFATSNLTKAALQLWQQGFLKAAPNLALVTMCTATAGLAQGAAAAVGTLFATAAAVTLSGLARRAGQSVPAYCRDQVLSFIQR